MSPGPRRPRLRLAQPQAHPYGTALAYGPIVELLKQQFQIDTSDRDEEHPGQNPAGLASAPSWQRLPPMWATCWVWTRQEVCQAGLIPEAVKYRTFEALRGFVSESASRRPLVLTVKICTGWTPRRLSSSPLSLSTSLAPVSCCCARIGRNLSVHGHASRITASSPSPHWRPPMARRCCQLCSAHCSYP